MIRLSIIDINKIKETVEKGEFVLSHHAHEERQAEAISKEGNKMAVKDIYGDCNYCGGEIEEQKIMVDFWWEGKLFLIEDVPAGICKQCGEKYFTAKVSKEMDELVKTQAVEKILQVPVKRFKEAFVA